RRDRRDHQPPREIGVLGQRPDRKPVNPGALTRSTGIRPDRASGPAQTHRIERELTHALLLQFGTDHERFGLSDVAQKPRVLVQKYRVCQSVRWHGAAVAQNGSIVEPSQNLTIRSRTCEPAVTQSE